MNDNLEYIDDYFQKQLSEEQRRSFEARCLSDKKFAGEVAMYVSTRQALRETLIQQKNQEWAALVPDDLLTTTATATAGQTFEPASTQSTTQAPVKKLNITRWLALAAACIIATVVIYPLFQQDSADQLVHEYVRNELVLSNTMDASRDSMQTAIVAYKNQHYPEAIQIFSSLSKTHPEDQQTLKYLGQSYLLNKNYNEAINVFDRLSAIPGLQSNAGPFLKGITLMERNQPGDRQLAKTLFQQVTEQDLEGKKQAEEWLRKMSD